MPAALIRVMVARSVRALCFVSLLLVGACASPPSPRAPGLSRACAADSDCDPGERCEPPTRCDALSRCAPPSTCSDTARVTLCGCDGASFEAPAACPGRSVKHPGACTEADRPPPPEPPPGAVCTADSDCDEGWSCQGIDGCGTEWRCRPRRACASEVTAFCDCDGATFYASLNCPGKPFASRGPCSVGATDFEPFAPLETDATCTSSDDCRGRRICTGLPGCGRFWTCDRVRRCTRDRVPFCACDGQTFYASSTCPGRPYAHPGACGSDALADAGAPRLDAASVDAGSRAPSDAGVAPRDAGQLASFLDAGARDGGVASRPTLDAGRAGFDARPAALLDAGFRPDAIARADASLAFDSAPRADAGARPDAGSRTDASPRNDAGPRAAERAPGLRCLANSDCATTEFCRAVAGCAESSCAPRPESGCNPDTQYFCDCNGVTFRASMNCPGRPFAHRGSCLPGE